MWNCFSKSAGAGGLDTNAVLYKTMFPNASLIILPTLQGTVLDGSFEFLLFFKDFLLIFTNLMALICIQSMTQQ